MQTTCYSLCHKGIGKPIIQIESIRYQRLERMRQNHSNSSKPTPNEFLIWACKRAFSYRYRLFIPSPNRVFCNPTYRLLTEEEETAHRQQYAKLLDTLYANASGTNVVMVVFVFFSSKLTVYQLFKAQRRSSTISSILRRRYGTTITTIFPAHTNLSNPIDYR